MSMLGIRDLSVIETPPTNRYPVQTYVLEKNDSVIRDAVLREKWSVEVKFTIFTIKLTQLIQKVSELQELIPEASIRYVHGQMSEIQLENTLLDFIEGQYDILVTTTIIGDRGWTFQMPIPYLLKMRTIWACQPCIS